MSGNALASPGAAPVEPGQAPENVAPAGQEPATPATPEQDTVTVVTNTPDEPEVQATGEIQGTAAAAAPAEPGEEPDQVDDTPEPTGDQADRIAKLEKRLGYETRQRQKLERQLSARPTKPENLPTAAPKAEDFETYDEYQDALVEWKVEQKLAKRQEEVDSVSAQDDLSYFRDETNDRGREMYSDYDAIALSDQVPITQPMIEILQDCDNPESIVYYLGKNIKDATAISRMSPTQAARAIGIIENKVAAQLKANPIIPGGNKPVKKTVSQAPEPIKPTGSGNVIGKDPEKMTQAEYEAWRASGGGR